MDMVEKARTFAIAAHSAVGEVRKYTGEPYHVHLEEVAWIVQKHGGSQEQIAAAWLHDVVEDTWVTIDLVQYMFGPEVSEIVSWLTDVSTYDDGNRPVRKAIDRAHTARAPKTAKFIKLADLCSNSRSIVEHDPGFARVYLEEKRLLIEEAFYDMSGDLFEETKRLLKEGQEALKNSKS